MRKVDFLIYISVRRKHIVKENSSGVMLAVLLLSVVASLGVIVPVASADSDGW